MRFVLSENTLEFFLWKKQVGNEKRYDCGFVISLLLVMLERMKHRIFYSSRSRWRKFIGCVMALLFIAFALSGVALNHSRSLHLDQIYIGGAYRAPVPDDYLIGAVIYDESVVVASADDLFIVWYGGEIVERVSDVLEDGERILRIGMSRKNNAVVLESNKGRFVCDVEMHGCDPTKEVPVWTDMDDISPVVHTAVLAFNYQESVSLEEALQMLHLGGMMPFVMDIFWAFFLCFALLGLWLWARQK